MSHFRNRLHTPTGLMFLHKTVTYHSFLKNVQYKPFGKTTWMVQIDPTTVLVTLPPFPHSHPQLLTNTPGNYILKVAQASHLSFYYSFSLGHSYTHSISSSTSTRFSSTPQDLFHILPLWGVFSSSFQLFSSVRHCFSPSNLITPCGNYFYLLYVTYSLYQYYINFFKVRTLLHSHFPRLSSVQCIFAKFNDSCCPCVDIF